PCDRCDLCRRHVRDLDTANEPDAKEPGGFLHVKERFDDRYSIGRIDMVGDGNRRIPDHGHAPHQLGRQHLAVRKDRVCMEVVQAGHRFTSMARATFLISAPFFPVHVAITRPSCRAQWAGWWCSSVWQAIPRRFNARSISPAFGPFAPSVCGTLRPSSRERAALK